MEGDEAPAKFVTVPDELTARSLSRARHVWEHPFYPQCYIPYSAIKSDLLTKADAIDHENSAFLATLKGESRSTECVLIFEKGPLSGLVRFEFDAMGKIPQYRRTSSDEVNNDL